MNIYEYQAKALLKKFKINVPKGLIAYTPSEAKRAALKISSNGPWVLKAQIQAGARAKGHFLTRKKEKISGIEIVRNFGEVEHISAQMFGGMLKTPQTDKKGKLVSRVYIEAFEKIKKSFYLSFVVNRIASCVTVLASRTTDDIVELAQKSPNAILRINLDLHHKIKEDDVLRLLSFLKLEKKYLPALKMLVQNLHKAFVGLDATLLEINPVGLTQTGEFVALDAKISFDNNALFRHPDIAGMRDDSVVGENVIKAANCGFKYLEFEDGNIGLIVNGDGLACAAEDYLEQMGEKVACSLNLKGGVDDQKIADSLKIMMSNPKVEGIIINILGGFLRCNLVADGIIAAISDIGLNIPLVARFEGTNKQEAKEILADHAVKVLTADTLQDAAVKLITAIKEGD